MALLARRAVEKTVQGHGIGAWLLRDAMPRTLGAAEAVGIRVLLAHAIEDNARASTGGTDSSRRRLTR